MTTLYFWSNGDLKGIHEKLSPASSVANWTDSPKRLELLFAPDGTLFAHRHKCTVYTHTYAEDRMLAITQDKIRLTRSTMPSPSKPGTISHIPVGTNVVFKTQKQMAFGRGFGA